MIRGEGLEDYFKPGTVIQPGGSIVMQERPSARRNLDCAVILALAMLFGTTARGSQETAIQSGPLLKDLLTGKQYATYSQRPKYKERVVVFHHALDSLASDLRGHLKKMEMEVVLENLGKMRSLSRYLQLEPSRESAAPKDLRSKEVKKMEIRLRRLVSTLNDFKLSVPFDFRSDFETTIRDLEELRNQLLVQLFGKTAAARRPPD